MSQDQKPDQPSSPLPAAITIAVLVAVAFVGAFVLFNTQKEGGAEGSPPIQTASLPQENGDYPPMPQPSQGYIPGEDADHANGVEPASSSETAEVQAAGAETSLSESDKKEINRVAGLRALGDPAAPVKIQEFFSLGCGHCAQFYTSTFPGLKEKYIDTGRVYFVFDDMPLDKPSIDAAITARCLPEDKYESFIHLLFKTQRQWATQGYMKALRQNAKLAGLSDDALDFCLNTKDIRESLSQGRFENQEKYGVKKTPTFIFNDGAETIVGAASLSTFDTVIDKLIRDSDGDGN